MSNPYNDLGEPALMHIAQNALPLEPSKTSAPSTLDCCALKYEFFKLNFASHKLEPALYQADLYLCKDSKLSNLLYVYSKTDHPVEPQRSYAL